MGKIHLGTEGMLKVGTTRKTVSCTMINLHLCLLSAHQNIKKGLKPLDAAGCEMQQRFKSSGANARMTKDN